MAFFKTSSLAWTKLPFERGQVWARTDPVGRPCALLASDGTAKLVIGAIMIYSAPRGTLWVEARALTQGTTVIVQTDPDDEMPEEEREAA